MIFKENKNKRIVYAIVALLLLSCQSLNFPSEELIAERDKLRDKRSYIDDEWKEADPLFRRYDTLKQGVPNAKYYPIWFNSIGDKMSAFVYKTDTSNRGTVLVIHGYAGNNLGYRHIIPRLLKENYTVIALTLPGHAISGGARGDIDKFENYGIVIDDLLTQIRGKVPPVNYAIGHSTGGTSLLIYNQNFGWDFSKVILIAPLIRSTMWYASLTARFLTKPFIQYYNTAWSELLAVQVFPMHWLDELKKWNKRSKKYQEMDDKILVLQGSLDKVVDWKYNTKFIQKLYPNSELILYENGDHVIFVTNNPDRDEAVNTVINSILETTVDNQ